MGVAAALYENTNSRARTLEKQLTDLRARVAVLEARPRSEPAPEVAPKPEITKTPVEVEPSAAEKRASRQPTVQRQPAPPWQPPSIERVAMVVAAISGGLTL